MENMADIKLSAGGHRRQHARLVAAYLQSQSQASSRRQRGDKTQWNLVIATFRELWCHVPANGGREAQKSGFVITHQL